MTAESAGKRLLRGAVGAAVRRRASCVFVLSTGRVGTVTLTHLVNLSPAVDAEHEPGPQLLAETRSAYQDDPLPPRAVARLMRTFAASRVRPLWRAARRDRVYVESSNRLTLLAPHLSVYLPRSRFIFIHRDPATIVRSGMRRGWYRNHPWDVHRITPRSTDPFAGEWDRWGPFERCCWLWAAVNGFCADLVERLPADRVFATSMEALFRPDGSGAQRLFAWLGVPAGASDAIRRVVTTRYNEQRENDFPHWSEWTAAQRGTLARITEPVAERLGYPVDVEAS